MRISERDMEIVRRWNQGGDTLQSIAIDYDVSRERIRQILKSVKIRASVSWIKLRHPHHIKEFS